jgi:putative phosphoribosyl transferase
LKPAFKHRDAAGRRVAGMLKKYSDSDALVLAIPAGGVPVAIAIAKLLGLQLQVIPVSKVLFPWTTEGGFGAVAFDGTQWIDHAAIDNFGLKTEQIEKAIALARAKVERRNARLRGHASLPEFKNSTVILVDDGIAAGSTMRTAITALRKRLAGRVVVAVPTAHDRSVDALRKLADEIVCPDIRGGMCFAVADAYEEWCDLSDDEIEAMLKS